MKILVTGVAGFIGSAVAQQLLERGDHVIGIDNLNGYYSKSLKRSRLLQLTKPQFRKNFSFEELDVMDVGGVRDLLVSHNVQKILHLAAQAGVRYSLERPQEYIDSNVSGFLSILETAKDKSIEHLVYASSSSVYGKNQEIPYSINQNVDQPISIYAATKKSNELMAHVYSHLYRLPTTGLRFFTAYGPWGRPDMSPFLFTKAILSGKPVKLFDYGRHKRDFTYIDDIVNGVLLTLDNPPTAKDKNSTPCKLYNLGSNSPVDLRTYLSFFEEHLGQQAIIEELPIQQGDVETTFADIGPIQADFGYQPKTDISQGVKNYVNWHLDYYKGDQ
jgi:UDP-glucuronate 4-epimerase